ncbi:hypothetical protein [Piscinibacter koreensis]|uniref:Uncharacterized protein n=1 Tax=Piscinibacter koreensis TaxID=2742824 RepID=A0A7Y6TX63_9BURK|nr:hypothetical protein [Schlegelella koreensis]NUZ06740.1 hypothetical protein [Schlegelella koreensis]
MNDSLVGMDPDGTPYANRQWVPWNYEDEAWLKSIGYAGGPIYETTGGDVENGYTQGESQAWKDFKANSGLRFATMADHGQYRLQAFDKDGKKVGIEQSKSQDDGGDAFGLAILAAVGGVAFMAASAAGAGAAAGAGSAAGGGTAGATSAGLGAAELGGLSGMELAADAGFMGANGIGGAAASFGGAGSAGLGAGLSGMDLAADAGYMGANGIGGAAGSFGGAAGSGLTAAQQAYGQLEAANAAAGGGGNLLAGTSAAVGAGSSLIPGVSNGALLSAGTQLAGGLIGQNAINKGLDAQLEGIDKANALQKYMFDTIRADNAPWRTAGTNALARIEGLQSNPGSIVNDPGYAWQRDQGQQALDRRAAAHGGLYSGAALKDASRFNTDYATTKLDQSYNRLLSMAGLGQVGLNNTSQAGQNYANNASQNMIGAGNAAASGYVGSANTWQNALSGLFNNYQMNDWLEKYGRKP